MSLTNDGGSQSQTGDPFYDLLLKVFDIVPSIFWCEFKMKLEERSLLKECDQEWLADQFNELFASWWKDDFIPKMKANFEELEPILRKVVKIGEEPMQSLGENWERVGTIIESMKAKGALPEGLSAEEFMADILSEPSIQLPPGHNLLKILGLAHAGEWNSLPTDEKIGKLLSIWENDERRKVFSKSTAKLVHKSTDDTTHTSVSRDRTDYLEIDNVSEPVDDNSLRFIRELEEKDNLERLIMRANLNPTDRLILAGMLQGLGGIDLEDYVLQQQDGKNIQRKSISVLANRVRNKLKRCA